MIGRTRLFQVPCCRSFVRASVESSLFFVVPCVVSGILYCNVIKALKGMQKHQKRNRNLTVAFCCGWVLWIVCWAPSYFLLLYKTGLYKYMPPTWALALFFYGDLLQLPLQMLFSQLNPFLYIIIFKRSREYIREKVFEWKGKIPLLLLKRKTTPQLGLKAGLFTEYFDKHFKFFSLKLLRKAVAY